MSTNLKIIFIVIMGISACLLSIFFSQYFSGEARDNQQALTNIDKAASWITQIRLLDRKFIQDAEQTSWQEIILLRKSIRNSLRATLLLVKDRRQEIESLILSLEDYYLVLNQLYEPALDLKKEKNKFQETGLTFSFETEEKIIKPYRKEEGFRIFRGESIDPFKTRVKDEAYDILSLHLKQQLLLLELILTSNIKIYKQEREVIAAAITRSKSQLNYIALLIGNEPAIQSILDSLEEKIESLLSREQAIVEYFTVLLEIDNRLNIAGEKLSAASGELSRNITADMEKTNRLNIIFNWSLMLGILAGLGILGLLLAGDIIKFVKNQKLVENEIRTLNTELEQRVVERTTQLEHSNHELEAFAFSVSHDLRAPLRGIEGFSKALLEDYSEVLDEEGKDYLHRVCAGTKHMALLIDDLLQLSRSSIKKIEWKQFDLSSLAEEVITSLRTRNPERRVIFEKQEGLDVRGDVLLMKTVMENLLGNAWKFTKKREEAHVSFGIIKADKEPRFFIKDNGAGFDMQYINKLFTPFQRLHSGEEFPGTGVGLTNVKRIINKHGGKIWAESEGEGKGAVFYFTLPK